MVTHTRTHIRAHDQSERGRLNVSKLFIMLYIKCVLVCWYIYATRIQGTTKRRKKFKQRIRKTHFLYQSFRQTCKIIIRRKHLADTVMEHFDVYDANHQINWIKRRELNAYQSQIGCLHWLLVIRFCFWIGSLNFETKWMDLYAHHFNLFQLSISHIYIYMCYRSVRYYAESKRKRMEYVTNKIFKHFVEEKKECSTQMAFAMVSHRTTDRMHQQLLVLITL